MKTFIPLLLAAVMLFSFSVTAFAVKMTYSVNDCLPIRTSEEGIFESISNGYQYHFNYENVESGFSEEKRLQFDEFFEKYLSAIDDPSKTIFFSFPPSTVSESVIYLFVLDNPTFSYRVLDTYGNKEYNFKADGFRMYFKLDKQGIFKNGVVTEYSKNKSVVFPSRCANLFQKGNKPSYIDDAAFYMLTGMTNFEITKKEGDLPSHALTINYKHTNGTQAAEPVIQTVEAGTEYSVTSPAIPGYTPDKPTVSGTMPNEDLTVNVTYTKAQHTLTVNYKYPNGEEAAPSVIQTLEYGAQYNVLSPEVAGYRPDIAAVSGAMPDNNLTVDVTYSKGMFTLNIQYLYQDGSEAYPEYNSPYLYGFSYSVNSPEIAGYKPDKAVIEGVMPGNDVSETVVYREAATPDYTLTVVYQYENGSQALEPVVQSFEAGEQYVIASPKIEGYRADKAQVSGVMPKENVFITVTYVKETVTPPGPGESGDLWGNFGYDSYYDPFHDPFGSNNTGSSSSNPFSSLLDGISGFSNPFGSITVPEYNGNDPFAVPKIPSYSGYDPFHDPFNSNNLDGRGVNPYGELWGTISRFKDPVLGG